MTKMYVENIAVRLVGGPADGLILSVPEANLPLFFGVGFPVSRYEPEPGEGDVRIFRYVSVNLKYKQVLTLLAVRPAVCWPVAHGF
jgi:hypothetical protein